MSLTVFLLMFLVCFCVNLCFCVNMSLTVFLLMFYCVFESICVFALICPLLCFCDKMFINVFRSEVGTRDNCCDNVTML